MTINYSSLNETECKTADDCRGDCVCVDEIGVCLNEKIVADSLYRCSCDSDNDCWTTDKCDMVTKKCWQCQSEAVSSAVNFCALLPNATNSTQNQLKSDNQSHLQNQSVPSTPTTPSTVRLSTGKAMNFTTGSVEKATFALGFILFMIFVRISIVRRRSTPK